MISRWIRNPKKAMIRISMNARVWIHMKVRIRILWRPKFEFLWRPVSGSLWRLGSGSLLRPESRSLKKTVKDIRLIWDRLTWFVSCKVLRSILYPSPRCSHGTLYHLVGVRCRCQIKLLFLPNYENFYPGFTKPARAFRDEKIHNLFRENARKKILGAYNYPWCGFYTERFSPMLA